MVSDFYLKELAGVQICDIQKLRNEKGEGRVAA